MEELDKIAAARREARIQRILSNSKNRLNKIAGKETVESEFDIPQKEPEQRIIYPDPEIERDVYEIETPTIPSQIDDLIQVLNNFNQMEPNGFGGQSQPNQMHPNGFGGQSQANQMPYASKMTKFLRTKIHFALIAIITYVMVATNTVITANIFLMFLLWEAAEVFLLKTYEVNKISFISILFMLGGIPLIHSTAIIKFLETVAKILNDVAIFVFYFVISHILWKILILGSSFENITNFEMNLE